METWKKIKDANINYEVSNLGKVRNVKSNRVLKLKKIIIRGGKYTIVCCNLRKGKKAITKTVSRLVLMAFSPIENPENYHADHIDHNPTNNNLSNLRWVTPHQNNLNRRSIEYYEEQLKQKDQIIADLLSKLNLQ